MVIDRHKATTPVSKSPRCQKRQVEHFSLGVFGVFAKGAASQ
jgi:hypothetical protein